MIERNEVLIAVRRNCQIYQTKQQEVVTMIPEKLLEIIKKYGVVAIATLGKDGPHMVNTWNT